MSVDETEVVAAGGGSRLGEVPVAVMVKVDIGLGGVPVGMVKIGVGDCWPIVQSLSRSSKSLRAA